MSAVRKADPDLDSLIDEITIDSHGEDEQLMGLRPRSTRTRTSHVTAPSSAKKSKSSPSAEATTAAS